MFMDESRFGQQGTLTRVWAPQGSRPTAVKQTRYEWVYLYAAVDPATGFSSALLTPHVKARSFNLFLKTLSNQMQPRDHVVLIMDQAGWHVSREVRMPRNITAFLLPPDSPELNPIERLWAYLKSHHLSNRAYLDDDHLLDAGTDAWNALTPQLIQSICRCDYLPRAK
jgi:transposase